MKKSIEFEVFTKMSSLSPRQGIPMLQIVIKHPQIIFICTFSERSTFSVFASHADSHPKRTHKDDTDGHNHDKYAHIHSI